VYVDVRGTGRSAPLNCLDIQTKSSPEEHFSHPYPKQELEACLEMYRDSIDFNFYKSTYIVEDLEEVREWLGYEKINILAISFGGKVSLMYMDRYPNSISRVALHGPDAPNIDYVSHRGRYSQRALDIVFTYCEEDSLCHANYPNIKQEFDALMNRLKKGTITQEITIDDSIHQIELSWPPVAGKIANMLYSDASYIQIPFIVHEAFKENYEPLLDAFDLTNTETSFVFADGMWLSNICGEDLPEATRNYDEAEKESFLGDYIYQTRKDACDSWPVNPADENLYKSVVSDIPTLILSGHVDPTLPPETGAKIASGLSNSQHIIIPYMAHGFPELSNLDCYDNYVLSFLEGREDQLNVDCFDEMKPGAFRVLAKEQL
ncbi:MAG: alpha/beta fold hydrolase, partial [Bacteroidetes bacterium]|nr:alpha/beta fold hydrolase [Bacteroidota bacterium]